MPIPVSTLEALPKIWYTSDSQAWAQTYGYFASGRMRGGLFFLSDYFGCYSTFQHNMKCVACSKETCTQKTCTHELTRVRDTDHCSGYSAMTAWERMVDRGKEYIVIKNKKYSFFPPIPTYCEIVILMAVTLLSSSFASISLWQQLLCPH